MNKKNRKNLRLLIFILLVLSAILLIIPGVLTSYKIKYYDTQGLVVEDIINKYKSIYFILLIVTSLSLIFFRTFFFDDYEKAKKIGDKKLYDKTNLRANIPKEVSISLIGIVILMIIIGFIVVK